MVKFGIYLPQANVDYHTVKRVALECERQGFDSAWITDHLLPWYLPPSSPLQDSYLECWTTLSALAAVTTKLRLGTLVLCNLFRYPSVLAKMAATLDVISDGRLEFGIGAGWFEPEFVSYGIPFPKASIRIAQLQEALTMMKKMWTEERATFQGQYYRIQEAFCNPKPVQKPHPPIWVGVMIGKKRMFETIAKYADGWAVASLYLPKPEEYKRQIEELQTYCLQAGRSVENTKKALGVACVVAENQRALKEKTRRFSPIKVSVEKYLATQPRLEGTPEQCVERLKNYVDVGVTHIILSFPDVTTLEPLRLFGEHVISVFKEN